MENMEKPFKIWNSDRTIRKSIVANSLQQMVITGKYFNISVKSRNKKMLAKFNFDNMEFLMVCLVAYM